MRLPHFFKAKSRIGLTNAPVRREELNLGVEDGSDAILTKEFLSQFENVEVDSFVFPTPEEISADSYFKILADSLVSFKDLINNSLKPEETQVVVGGDNSITFASLLALTKRLGDAQKIGYIQFDSHGEMNSLKGSESKNFHGMYMRPFFDKFDQPEIERLSASKFKPNQALFIGDLVLDGDEPKFFEEKKFRNINRSEYLGNLEKVRQEVHRFVKSFKHVHINFDIDVFHNSQAGATGIPEDGKWFKKEVFDLLTIIGQNKNISMDISEVNPTKAGAKQTIKIAQQVLSTMLS